jgi:hypothetical protein
MTVLVEGVSVIIKLESIERVVPDGFEGFRQYIPNYAWCKDAYIFRQAFLSKEDAKEFTDKLESLGLVHMGTVGAQDFALVDQMYGIANRCGWLEFGYVNLENDAKKQVAACQLRGTKNEGIITPQGWNFENSLSKEFGLNPAKQPPQ